MCTYFIAYFYIDGLGHSRMGNTIKELPRPLTNRRDIRQIEATIQSKNPSYMYVAVTNFQLLEGPVVDIKQQPNQEKGEAIC